MLAINAGGTLLVPPGSKWQTVGTKLVRGLFDCAESHVFSGL